MEARTRTFPDLVVLSRSNGQVSEPEHGLKRRVLAYNDKLFLAEPHSRPTARTCSRRPHHGIILLG
jgi:hypothetical protein